MKKHTQLALIGSITTFSIPAMSQNQLELVMDGYAYPIISDVVFNIDNRTITIAESETYNCLQFNQSLPLNSGTNFTLLTNNQSIGISNTKYSVDSNLLFFTSETNNLICDDGIDVDTIFTQGFEKFISPFVIFADGFD